MRMSLPFFLTPETLPAVAPDAFQISDTPPPSPVERYSEVLASVLDKERRREADLSAEIERLSETLRQTRLIISELSPAFQAIAKDAGRDV